MGKLKEAGHGSNFSEALFKDVMRETPVLYTPSH